MRWEFGALIFVVFLFIGLQAVLIQSPAVWSDESLYAWYALQIIESPANLFSPMLWEFHPPLFALVASLPARVLDPLLSVRLVSALMAALSVCLTFWVGKKFFSVEVGVIAALLLALSPHYLFFTPHGLLESTQAVGVLLAVGGIAHAFRTNDHRIWFLGGGIALLSKRSSFLVVAGIALSLWWGQHQKNKLGRKSILPVHAFLPLALLVVGSALALVSFARERDSAWSGNFISLLATHISSVALLLFPLFILMGWLLFESIRKKDYSIAQLCCWIFLGCFLTTLAYPLFDSRHLLPVYPIIFLLTAAGMVSCAQWISKKWGFHTTWLLRAAVIFFCAVQLIALPPIIHHAIAPMSFLGYPEEGKWLRENAQGAWIYDSKERETRLYSGIELSAWGGNIHPFPHAPEAFRGEILTQKKPVYAIVMNWKNPFAPQYPDDAFLEKEGFKKAKGIVVTINGKRVEVIRIYRLE